SDADDEVDSDDEALRPLNASAEWDEEEDSRGISPWVSEKRIQEAKEGWRAEQEAEIDRDPSVPEQKKAEAKNAIEYPRCNLAANLRSNRDWSMTDSQRHYNDVLAREALGNEVSKVRLANHI